eukprot:790221_1
MSSSAVLGLGLGLCIWIAQSLLISFYFPMTAQLLKTSTDGRVLFDDTIFAIWTYPKSFDRPTVWGSSPGYFMSEHKIFIHHHIHKIFKHHNQHKISRQYVISGALVSYNFLTTTGGEVSLLALLTNLYVEQKGECKDVKSQKDNKIYTTSLPINHYEPNITTILNSNVSVVAIACKLSYISSCSINSITCYLFADIHTQNILINLKSSELIHIELGVAFDQLKLLKKPELPLELTRDISDGYGLTSYRRQVLKLFIDVCFSLQTKTFFIPSYDENVIKQGLAETVSAVVSF